jgi:hypothetical protein
MTVPVPLYNNPVENAIRPFAIGRKNWLFSASVKGAKASANLYSLIETAKANGLEPYAYLKHIFTELPKAEGFDDVDQLLPANVTLKKIRSRPQAASITPLNILFKNHIPVIRCEIIIPSIATLSLT